MKKYIQIPLVLKEIIISNKTKNKEEKGIICLRGFSTSVFLELKNLFSDNNEIDVLWITNVSEGIELIKVRNDRSNRKTTIVFIDTYFSIAQSLEHFPKLSDLDLLYNKQYFEILLKISLLRNDIANDTLSKLLEAFKVIIEEVNPSLLKFIDFLDEINQSDDLLVAIGASLWKLSLFKHNDLFKNHTYKPTSAKQQKKLLKKSFWKAISNNLYYSGPSAINLLTLKSISKSEINNEHKKLLFEYLQTGHSENLYRSIDFETILSINKQKRIPKNINIKNTNGNEKLIKDVLVGIASVISNYGTYNCCLDDNEEFELKIEKIVSFENYYKPQETYIKLYEIWKTAYNDKLESKDDSDSIVFKIDDDKSFDIDIRSDKIEPEYKISDLSNLENKILSNDLKLLVTQFIDNLKGIIEFLKYPYISTLHLDVEAYFISYSKILFYLITNARQLNSDNENIYNEVLSFFIDFGYKNNSKDSSIVISNYHPFKILTKRIDEICILELIDLKNKTINNNIDFDNDIVSISENLNEYKSKIWPKFLPRKINDNYIIFSRDIIHNEVVYKKSRIDRGGIEKPLLTQIENYVSNNLLSKLSLNLRVINPLDGKEIYNTMKKLYQSSDATKPEHVRISAMGPDEKFMFSQFDDASINSAENLEEIFLTTEGNIYPFCLYYKNNQKIDSKDNTHSKWVDNYIKEGDDFEADITIVIDPYKESFSPKTKSLDVREVKNIENIIDGSSQQNFIELIFANSTTYNNIIETLIIRNQIKAIDYKKYIIESQTDKYKQLIQKHQENDEWCMLFDRYLDDYNAEKISESLRDENSSVLSTVAESNNGTTYVFTYPSKESLNLNKIVTHLDIINETMRVGLASWLSAQYGQLANKKDFCNIFLKDQYRFVFSLSNLNSYDMKGLFVYQKAQYKKVINMQDYLIIFKFNLQQSFRFILTYDIHYLKDPEDLDYEDNSELIKVDLDFLKDDYSILNSIKRERFSNLLSTLLYNPFQSWFLAALNTNNVNSDKDSSSIVELENTNFSHINLWRLRELLVILTDTYNSAISSYSKYNKLAAKSILDKLNSSNPTFYKKMMQWELLEKFQNIKV